MLAEPRRAGQLTAGCLQLGKLQLGSLEPFKICRQPAAFIIESPTPILVRVCWRWRLQECGRPLPGATVL